MSKLKLDIDALQVESFVTTRPDSERGTVRANQSFASIDFCLPGRSSPEWTCQGNPTCGVATCAQTCPATCNVTCGNTVCISDCGGGGGTGTAVQTCNNCGASGQADCLGGPATTQ